MRRRIALLCLSFAAVPLTAVLSSPAGAQCPGQDATVIGTPARALAVTVGDKTFYIDDRDYLDADSDGDAGGIWIYHEDNGRRYLQRGGDQYIFETLESNGVDPSVPFIDPQPLPTGHTLFPNGFGGGGLAEMAGSHDSCVESIRADSIVF